jgi:hypothetical protein
MKLSSPLLCSTMDIALLLNVAVTKHRTLLN